MYRADTTMRVQLRIALATLSLATLLSCGLLAPQDEFFKGETAQQRSTRQQRMEAYTLERQWEIFLYGQQVLHPPDLALVEPIAKQGKVAADFIVTRLSTAVQDSEYFYALDVFDAMQLRGHFDLCANPDHLARMRTYEARIQRANIRREYHGRLVQICEIRPALRPRNST